MEQLIQEQHSKQTPAFLEWPEAARRAAVEFAGHLLCARQLFHRYPALVKTETFPQPFRFALQQEYEYGPETGPDQEIADYGDFSLIEQNLLLCLDTRIEAAAKRGENAKGPKTSKAAMTRKKSRKGKKSSNTVGENPTGSAA